MNVMHVKANPADIYLFEVSNTNTRKSCEIYSKLKIFIPNFQRISHLFKVFILLTLNMNLFVGKVSLSFNLLRSIFSSCRSQSVDLNCKSR